MNPDLSKLNADLVPYIEHTAFGPMLKHPFVFLRLTHIESPVVSKKEFGWGSAVELANQSYEWKREHITKALESGDWEQYVFLHERPYRFSALLEVCEWNDFFMAGLWPLVRDVWTDSENIWQCRAIWLDIWREPCPKRYRVMSRSERARLGKLPDMVTVWRGASRDDAITGMSWTLRREKAVWFAHRCAYGDQPRLLAKGLVSKTAVFAYLSSRKEAEVVLDPDELRIEHVERLSTNEERMAA